MNYASSYAEAHSIEHSVDRDQLSVQLSRIGASLPRELEERYRLAVQELMESDTKADLLIEADRIARDLEQIAHDEDEAIHTSRKVSFRTASMSGSVHRIRNNRNRRRY